ncbi:Histone acetyltransferase [Entamoeba marina]
MVSFKSYWTATILEELMASQTTLPVQELTLRTGITKEDCFSTLESLQMIKRYRGEQSMHFNRKQLEQNYEKHKLRRPLVKKQYLEWKPHSIAVKDSSAMESLKSYC